MSLTEGTLSKAKMIRHLFSIVIGTTKGDMAENMTNDISLDSIKSTLDKESSSSTSQPLNRYYADPRYNTIQSLPGMRGEKGMDIVNAGRPSPYMSDYIVPRGHGQNGKKVNLGKPMSMKDLALELEEEGESRDTLTDSYENVFSKATAPPEYESPNYVSDNIYV
jgi:hypothetical protein